MTTVAELINLLSTMPVDARIVLLDVTEAYDGPIMCEMELLDLVVCDESSGTVTMTATEMM